MDPKSQQDNNPPTEAQPTPLDTNILAKRIGAVFIDFIVYISIVVALLLATKQNFTNYQGYSAHALPGDSIVFCFVLVYYTFQEWCFGTTIGKRLLNIRVVNEAGGRITFGQSVARNIARIIDAFPPYSYVVGYMVAESNSKHQRIGDKLAKTLVVGKSGSMRDSTLGRMFFEQ